jgi:hypothetical protein
MKVSSLDVFTVTVKHFSAELSESMKRRCGDKSPPGQDQTQVIMNTKHKCRQFNRVI